MFHRRKTAKARSDSNLTLGRLIAQHLTLDLPIRGRMYRIACPTYSAGAPIAAVLAAVPGTPPGEVTAGQFVLDGATTDAALENLLGDQYGAMLLDGVPPEVIQHAAETVLVWLLRGLDVAIYHWSRWDPEKPAGAFVRGVKEG